MTLLQIRNKFYNGLPTEGLSFELALLIKEHLADLDECIDKYGGGGNHTVSDIADYVRDKLIQIQDRNMTSFNRIVTQRDAAMEEVNILKHNPTTKYL